MFLVERVRRKRDFGAEQARNVHGIAIGEKDEVPFNFISWPLSMIEGRRACGMMCRDSLLFW